MGWGQSWVFDADELHWVILCDLLQADVIATSVELVAKREEQSVCLTGSHKDVIVCPLVLEACVQIAWIEFAERRGERAVLILDWVHFDCAAGWGLVLIFLRRSGCKALGFRSVGHAIPIQFLFAGTSGLAWSS